MLLNVNQGWVFFLTALMQTIKTATGLLVRGNWVKYSSESINKIHNLALQSIF